MSVDDDILLPFPEFSLAVLARDLRQQLETNITLMEKVLTYTTTAAV